MIVRIFSLSPRSTALPLSKKLDPLWSTSSMRSPSVVTRELDLIPELREPGHLRQALVNVARRP